MVAMVIGGLGVLVSLLAASLPLPDGQSRACPIHAADLVTMATSFLRHSRSWVAIRLICRAYQISFCSNEGARRRDVMIHALIGLLWDFLY